MKPTLTRRARAAWLIVSAACYAATLCGADDAPDAAEASTSLPAIATPLGGVMPTSTGLAIRRDPFSGGPRAMLERSAADSANVSAIDRQDDATTTVPDIATSYPGDTRPLDAIRGASLSVRAIISAPHPVAYVAVDGDFAIVHVGDTVARRRVAAIDLRGLGFADGTRLDLPTSFVPTPSIRTVPRPPRDDRVRVELARIRQLILSRSRASAASPAPLVPDRPNETVTPAPLRTVDPNGSPVGVVPTPDASSGTAYPIPYPYAPRPH